MQKSDLLLLLCYSHVKVHFTACRLLFFFHTLEQTVHTHWGKTWGWLGTAGREGAVQERWTTWNEWKIICHRTGACQNKKSRWDGGIWCSSLSFVYLYTYLYILILCPFCKKSMDVRVTSQMSSGSLSIAFYI